MVARDIVRLAIFRDASPASVGCTGPAMVSDLEIEKALAGPAEHVGFHLIYSIGSGPNPKPPDCIPTTSPINFRASANVKRWVLLHCFLSVLLVVQKTSS